MNAYNLIATLLWTAFGLCIAASAAAVVLAWRGHRVTALVLLLIATMGLLIFSWIAGFSIGRITASLPVLLTGYMAGVGRGPAAVTIGVGGAALLYLAMSWWLTPLLTLGGVFAAVFGSWGILFYLLLTPVVFALAIAIKPSELRMAA